jgi:hypothetical protein
VQYAGSKQESVRQKAVGNDPEPVVVVPVVGIVVVAIGAAHPAAIVVEGTTTQHTSL